MANTKHNHAFVFVISPMLPGWSCMCVAFMFLTLELCI